jgi:hypothetical protein
LKFNLLRFLFTDIFPAFSPHIQIFCIFCN